MNASFAAHLVSLESVVSTTSGRSGGLLVGGQELVDANSIVGIQVALTNTKLQNVPPVFIFKMPPSPAIFIMTKQFLQEIGKNAACSPRHPGRRDGYSRHYPEIFRC